MKEGKGKGWEYRGEEGEKREGREWEGRDRNGKEGKERDTAEGERRVGKGEGGLELDTFPGIPEFLYSYATVHNSVNRRGSSTRVAVAYLVRK